MTAAVLPSMPAHKSSSAHYGHLDALIEPFKESKQPAASRVVTDVAQVKPKAMTVLDAWKYLPFFAVQASALSQAFVSHHLFGPPKPSWGIEMTLFTTALRASVDFSYLSSVQRMRRAINLGRILPTPKDGVITPVTFRVKRRGLKGFLADADAKEDGTRELNGEWVTNRRIWRKMQEQHRRSGSRSAPSHDHCKDRVIFYLHGGAYYIMSPASHRFLTIRVSKYTECRIFALDYRLSPETIFPGALHDAVSAYFRLVYDLKIPPENIIFGGDSAGGGLCLATMLYLRDNGYPLPSGAFLMSPWCDLTMSCESWDTNMRYDYLPRPADNDHMNPVKCYLGRDIVKYITHPYASPLFADFTDLPPMLVQCGDAEVLRDEVILTAYKASSMGVAVEHEVYEDCVHVFQAFVFLEASGQALHSIRRWVKRVLPSLQAKAVKELDEEQLDAEVMGDAHAVQTEDGDLDPQNLPQSPESRPISSEDDEDQPSLSSSSDSEEDVREVDKVAGRVEGAMLQAGAALSGKPSAFNPQHMRMSSKDQSAPSSTPTSPAKRPGVLHKRAHTEAYGSLPMRARTSSHPDVRALIDKLSSASSEAIGNTTLFRDVARSRTNSQHGRRDSRQASRQGSRTHSRAVSDDEGEGEFAEFATKRRA